MAAVDLSRVSKIVGYEFGTFTQDITPNLPQRIVILGEANTANQATLETTKKEITSAKQAGELYGYGSPIYLAMRILRPYQGGGVNSIPTLVIPQEVPVGATSKTIEVTPTGVATGNGTHTLVVAGREGLEGTFYDINIVTGDTAALISAKIEDAINNVLGCPMSATSTSTEAILESKWKGLTANDLTVTVNTNGKDLGITYAVVSTQSGSGTPSITDALAQFGNEWITIVVNTYGLTSTNINNALEAFNGNPNDKTGRYASTITKPFIALTGSVSENSSSFTDTKKEELTLAICPAPLSSGLQFEAAANMAVLFANVANNTPHLDVSGSFYPDMPTPLAIGVMAQSTDRDLIVKKGCSTVDLESGKYKVVDFVTTYHPIGEEPPQFRWCRNLNIDFNVRYGYYLLELSNVVDHAIANDNDIVSAQKVVKPKQWKQVLFKYSENLATRALIVDAEFMQKSIQVNLSTTNPDRLEVLFKYKRSGYARIVSTTAQAGFNFGTLNV